MNKLPLFTLPPLGEIIKNNGLRANKSFGQNFLLDLNITRKIARSIPNIQNSIIYEVGPGPGGLTRALLMEGASQVFAVEKDPRFIETLNEISKAFDNKLTFKNEDAISINESEFIGKRSQNIHIAANLPYNIGTFLLIKWLTTNAWPPFYSSLTLMFQKEVAERITAKTGSKSYGRLSVLSNWRAETKVLFDLPSRAFTPAPKVTSSVVQIIPKKPILETLNGSVLERVVKKAFGQRRKMLRSSLKGISPYLIKNLNKVGISETARAEEVSIEKFCELALVFQYEN
ncbi:MAG: 16S rRNA (adenine(1518)-N(6)/adenine(1519)-N(6))-dimethyltransferase RsmA [Sphingomonadales bacterium]|jgi:16S rRNA (adenine1518-N6/adenine1519-N6)-dimethyltransferase